MQQLRPAVGRRDDDPPGRRRALRRLHPRSLTQQLSANPPPEVASREDDRGSRAGIEATDRERALSPQTQPGGTAPSWLTDALRRIEDDRRLDAAADRLYAIADTVVSSPQRRDALRGVWFGHALHPTLTDFPLGSWMSASLLDLVGGRRARPASQRLIGGHLSLVRKVGTADPALTDTFAIQPQG